MPARGSSRAGRRDEEFRRRLHELRNGLHGLYLRAGLGVEELRLKRHQLRQSLEAFARANPVDATRGIVSRHP